VEEEENAANDMAMVEMAAREGENVPGSCDAWCNE
jgi:hypothetical protein